jgi:hypothetical protein
MKRTILILSILCFINPVFGHQPRIGFDKGTLINPIEIEKPEVSKAYYSELTGEPEYYQINSNTDFLLYLNILAPDIQGARTDFLVETFYDGELVYTIDSDD